MKRNESIVESINNLKTSADHLSNSGRTLGERERERRGEGPAPARELLLSFPETFSG